MMFLNRWSTPTRVTKWSLGLSIAISVATATYLASIYQTLPIGVPVRFVRGVALIYQVKSPMLVMLPAIVQGALLTIFGSLIMLLLWRARPGAARQSDPDKVDEDVRRMRLAAEGISLLALVWISVQAVSAIALIALWRRKTGGFGDLYNFALITAVVFSVVIAVRTLRLVGREKKVEREIDPAVWKLRQLYFNPGDPALFVPTRTGMGWTLNFGRPLAIVMLASTLLVGIGAPYMLALYVLRGLGG
jgi:uncharacterized membrane protein